MIIAHVTTMTIHHDNDPQSTLNNPPLFTKHISTPSELHDNADQCFDQGTDSRFLLCR